MMANGNLSGRVFGALCSLVLIVAVTTQAAAKDDNFFTHIHTDKAMANVTVSPGRSGPVEITIQLETGDERSLTAKAVTVKLSNAKAGTKPQTIEATKAGESEWRVKTSLPVRGRWTLGLGILMSDTDKLDVETPILVK